MTRHAAIWVASFVAVPVVGWWALRGAPSQRDAVSRTEGAREEAPAANDTTATRFSLPAPPTASRGSDEHASTTREERGRSGDEPQGAPLEEPDFEQILFEKEQEFQAAPLDVAAKQTEQKIWTAFHDLSADGTRIESVQCRKGLCRAVVEFPSRQADTDALERVSDGRSSPLADYRILIPSRERLADGRVKATLFVSSDSS
ncbi:MAG: hypothetical protein JW940_25755 [Polyangiaceae bacterium]|nr:hypothetical protein [Polyangiaceae bacterium]